MFLSFPKVQFTPDAEHLATGVRKYWNTLQSMGVFTQFAENSCTNVPPRPLWAGPKTKARTLDCVIVTKTKHWNKLSVVIMSWPQSWWNNRTNGKRSVRRKENWSSVVYFYCSLHHSSNENTFFGNGCITFSFTFSLLFWNFTRKLQKQLYPCSALSHTHTHTHTHTHKLGCLRQKISTRWGVEKLCSDSFLNKFN